MGWLNGLCRKCGGIRSRTGETWLVMPRLTSQWRAFSTAPPRRADRQHLHVANDRESAHNPAYTRHGCAVTWTPKNKYLWGVGLKANALHSENSSSNRTHFQQLKLKTQLSSICSHRIAQLAIRTYCSVPWSNKGEVDNIAQCCKTQRRGHSPSRWADQVQKVISGSFHDSLIGAKKLRK